MKKLLLFVFASLLFGACSKDLEQSGESEKKVYYKSLNEAQLDYNNDLHLDLNNDGKEDFNFFVSDDIVRKKLEFRVRTLNGSLLVGAGLAPKVFEKEEVLQIETNSKYTWTPNNAYLAYRIYTDESTTVWEGAWMNQVNKFMAVKIKSGNLYYTGWIRISIGGLQPKLIIHDYGYSKIADSAIKAGATN